MTTFYPRTTGGGTPRNLSLLTAYVTGSPTGPNATVLPKAGDVFYTGYVDSYPGTGVITGTCLASIVYIAYEGSDETWNGGNFPNSVIYITSGSNTDCKLLNVSMNQVVWQDSVTGMYIDGCTFATVATSDWSPSEVQFWGTNVVGVLVVSAAGDYENYWQSTIVLQLSFVNQGGDTFDQHATPPQPALNKVLAGTSTPFGVGTASSSGGGGTFAAGFAAGLAVED